MKKLIILIIILFISHTYCSAQKFGVGTDVISLTTATFNIEASLIVSKKLTLHLPLSWNPFTLKNNFKLKHIAIQPGIRWWFWHGYSEFYLGAHFLTSIFNIAVSSERKEGWAGGISFTCGYAWMLNQHMNLEIEAGGGPIYREYDKFEREICGDYLGTKKGVILFPTRLSCSLFFLF